jgi:ABC-2 type transport system permease protein
MVTTLYKSWVGQPRSPWWGCIAMVRLGISLLIRRWVFWGLIGLGLLNFLFSFALIYMKAQLSLQSEDIGRFVDSLQVTGTGRAYADFLLAQGSITTLLLAFAGSTLIGSDYRQGGLVFYLSRGIEHRHYLVGKLLTVAVIVSAITTLPAVILFLEYGSLSNSPGYIRENWGILAGILGYGTILAAVQSPLLCALAAWVPRTGPLVMSWLGLFVLLKLLAEMMEEIKDDRNWLLLALWDNMDRLGRWCFGAYASDRVPSPFWCAVVLGSVMLVSTAAFRWRIRAVEVVR